MLPIPESESRTVLMHDLPSAFKRLYHAGKHSCLKIVHSELSEQ